MYVAALGIALLGLAAVAMRRLGDRLRRSYALVFLSTAIALFAACDLTLGVSRLDPMAPSVLNFAVPPLSHVSRHLGWERRSSRFYEAKCLILNSFPFDMKSFGNLTAALKDVNIV
jgi:hypothetical protein